MKFSLSLGSFNVSIVKSAPVTGGKRSFAAGSINRLTSDWSTTVTSADVEARNDVTKLRSRCRVLERDDPYARHYFKLLRNNVLGWQGMRLEMKVKDPSGTLDAKANTAIEDAWTKWGKKANCTVSKNLSWRAVCWLVITAPARDGGVLVRKVPGFDNEFGFALQLLEIDMLDVYYNVPNCGRDQGTPGNEIRMGVELNQWKEPIAYHLWTRHPGDYNSAAGFKRERIPASEIVHLFMPDRVMQTIGTPWITSAMLRLNMLNGYEEAELVAARTAACKGGYITKEKPEQYTGDDVDSEGNQVEEMEPGVVRELDPGENFIEHDPKHPNTAYPAYIKQVLRGAAAGMAVNYNTLANDLEGVNYSSLRAGTLEDREEWMMIQEWFAEDLCDEVFKDWLPMAILSDQVKLPDGQARQVHGPDLASPPLALGKSPKRHPSHRNGHQQPPAGREPAPPPTRAKTSRSFWMPSKPKKPWPNRRTSNSPPWAARDPSWPRTTKPLRKCPARRAKKPPKAPLRPPKSPPSPKSDPGDTNAPSAIDHRLSAISALLPVFGSIERSRMPVQPSKRPARA